MIRLVLSTLLLLVPALLQAAEFSGKVVGVMDGDTIEVLHGTRPERIRLHGIDCPEKGQAFGQRAKKATSELVFAKEVQLETHGQDKYGRTIADVLLPDGTNVNQTLVVNGWCWWYRKYAPKDQTLKEYEETAKAERRGLWADKAPVPPWLYRRLRAGAYP